MLELLRAGDRLIQVASITSVDCSRIEALEVIIHHRDGSHRATGSDAIEALMVLRPSALEGRRLRFARRAWVVHNLVGHPLLQLFAWIGLRSLGLAIHDATVPRALGAGRPAIGHPAGAVL